MIKAFPLQVRIYRSGAPSKNRDVLGTHLNIPRWSFSAKIVNGFYLCVYLCVDVRLGSKYASEKCKVLEKYKVVGISSC